MRSKLLVTALALVTGLSALAAPQSDWTAKWDVQAEKADSVWAVTIKAEIAPGIHIYDIDNEWNPVSVEYAPGIIAEPLQQVTAPTVFNGENVLFKEAVFTQMVSAPEGTAISGTIRWQGCADQACRMPEEFEFSISPVAGEHSTPIEEEPAEGSRRGIWGLILEAILWGFAMLLTPCVFPMVPMTVSFFLKGSSGKGEGRFKAFMYGLFIVLLYTVPICVIIGLTRLIGGDAVTTNIFQWLSTHWLPNLIFFAVFMIFAASFFGAFEIVLPSSWQNRSDQNSAKKGLAGIFFMALTLVLVSFSCTGPVVGSVLIRSTSGEFWAPMVTMLAFSVAFALPFTLLALFPQMLTKLKSGSWLNSVKVVMGFIELALGLKFLSMADQSYHWGILDREVYLAIWIVIFTLLGFYLLGKIRFKYDDKVEHIGIVRLTLAIAVFSFVVYMVPGMFGAPLKALSGYLPPMETQDFVLGSAPGSTVKEIPADGVKPIAHNLPAYMTLEEGLAAAEEEGKPVFVDVTGLGCVNCREMEARVWSDPEVLRRLREDFVIVALYTDDHTRAPQSRWMEVPGGKVLKTTGQINSRIVRDRFGIASLPNYIIMSADGSILAGPRAYDLSIPGFIGFLDSALK